jgi:DNA primase small subunit
MFEKSKEAEFMENIFSNYYSKNFVELSSIENREFGYGVFGRKIANRNLAFSSAKEMNYFLRNQKPLFFSYSNAYYKYPDRKPMLNKEIIKADLIYEFDADDLGEVEEIDGQQWFSVEDLEKTKSQVFRLLDFIENDFNFPMDSISINFSGKAGYHIHLRGKEIQNLSKQARIELVDYILGTGIYFDNLGYDFEGLLCAKGRGRWIERINSGLKNFFLMDAKTISNLTGFPAPKIKPLIASAGKEIVSSMEKGYLFPISPRKNKEFWTKVFELVMEKEKIPIDRQTSIDLHKIIRVPETLHGNTGFVAKIISIDELKNFDPYKDAVVFGEERVRLFIKKAPKFCLKGQWFGPFENSEEELPLYCAVYLIGKGAKLL